MFVALAYVKRNGKSASFAMVVGLPGSEGEVGGKEGVCTGCVSICGGSGLPQFLSSTSALVACLVASWHDAAVVLWFQQLRFKLSAPVISAGGA